MPEKRAWVPESQNSAPAQGGQRPRAVLSSRVPHRGHLGGKNRFKRACFSAYAITVHKAQGSEYRAVILSAVEAAPMLLTRGVLYTAMTRAKDLLILVGDDHVVARMAANDRQQRRYSGLRARLARGLEGM